MLKPFNFAKFIKNPLTLRYQACDTPTLKPKWAAYVGGHIAVIWDDAKATRGVFPIVNGTDCLYLAPSTRIEVRKGRPFFDAHGVVRVCTPHDCTPAHPWAGPEFEYTMEIEE